MSGGCRVGNGSAESIGCSTSVCFGVEALPDTVRTFLYLFPQRQPHRRFFSETVETIQNLIVKTYAGVYFIFKSGIETLKTSP